MELTFQSSDIKVTGRKVNFFDLFTIIIFLLFFFLRCMIWWRTQFQFEMTAQKRGKCNSSRKEDTITVGAVRRKRWHSSLPIFPTVTRPRQKLMVFNYISGISFAMWLVEIPETMYHMLVSFRCFRKYRQPLKLHSFCFQKQSSKFSIIPCKGIFYKMTVILQAPWLVKNLSVIAPKNP